MRCALVSSHGDGNNVHDRWLAGVLFREFQIHVDCDPDIHMSDLIEDCILTFLVWTRSGTRNKVQGPGTWKSIRTHTQVLKIVGYDQCTIVDRWPEICVPFSMYQKHWFTSFEPVPRCQITISLSSALLKKYPAGACPTTTLGSVEGHDG